MLLLRVLLWLALAGLLVLTVLSWLGNMAGALDLLSHFRLHFAVAAGVLMLAGLAMRRIWPAALAGVLIAANLAGSLAYPHRSVETAAGNDGRVLKIISFNIRWAADNADRLAHFLEKEQADIVVLEEVTPSKYAELLRQVAKLYPWRAECEDELYCRMAIWSRHRWVSAAVRSGDPENAAATTATFGPELGDLKVVGVHMTRPWPWWHAHRAQIASVVKLAQATPAQPVIMLGDFNATPWSRTIRTISTETGLLPAGGYHPTWPMRLSKLGDISLFPQLQIDQMLMPAGVKLLSFRTGPDLGSDHLPLIARVAVPVKWHRRQEAGTGANRPRTSR